MDRLLAPIADRLDSSVEQELIYIPSTTIKSKVPDYTLSHINSNGVDFQHTLRGIAYARSQIGAPNGAAQAAWHVYERSDDVFVEEDPLLPYTRVYEFSRPFFMWHLVAFPPAHNPENGPPQDWYIGSCADTAGSFSCRQVAEYQSVYYEYKLEAADMHLRTEVRQAVAELISEWNQSCE